MLLTSASRRRSHVRQDIATLPPVNGRAHMSEAHTPHSLSAPFSSPCLPTLAPPFIVYAVPTGRDAPRHGAVHRRRRRATHCKGLLVVAVKRQ